MRGFCYALKARKAFASGFTRSVTMQRLRGICGIKNSRTGREAVGQAHGWRDQREDFGNLKAAVFAGINARVYSV